MTYRASATVTWPATVWPHDFGPVWYAARSVLNGIDPYPLVGPHLAFEWGSPLVYPLPAALVAIPFTPFPEPVASALFSAIGAACLAWALMQWGYAPLFGFFSMAVRQAVEAAQWSMLFAASFVLAPLAFLLIAKPTIGIALFFARPRWRAVVGGVVLGGIAFFVLPRWPLEWWEAVQRYVAMGGGERPYRPVIVFPGGFLALLTLLRWRRPEARLVAALVCAPITLMGYEMVPLFLVPRTFWQTALLVALSHAQYYLTLALTPTPWTHAGMEAVTGQLFVLLLYLPATVMVLRRPNEGKVPACLERWAQRWPVWLRGQPDAVTE